MQTIQRQLASIATLMADADFNMTTLPDGSSVVLDHRRHRVFSLSETATIILSAIRAGIVEPAALTAKITDDFDVTAETASDDIAVFLEELELCLAEDSARDPEITGPHADD
jgi:ABC-type Fe2+-enterobactin transport system substrate-binding protein